MAQPDSIQDSEINFMTDTPTADLFTVHQAFLHVYIQILKQHRIPFRILSSHDRELQALDVEMKPFQSFLLKPEYLSCRVHIFSFLSGFRGVLLLSFVFQQLCILCESYPSLLTCASCIMHLFNCAHLQYSTYLSEYYGDWHFSFICCTMGIYHRT